ncbi:MAG: SWIM zinc finger family protein [Tepidisphaerales bacterium]
MPKGLEMRYWDFKPYVRVADRRRNAEKMVAKLASKGRKISPVKLSSKKIATTFWGKAWCENLESYSDYANRLPRGRTYVRNGSVIDLQIAPGKITAMVSGSEVYDIEIEIDPLDKKKWQAIKTQCAGKVASMIELLQGKLSGGVMEIITRHDGGLFPSPGEISMACSCPDGAYMCKHLAAVLYGVGARLDEQPEIFFTLRKVDQTELIDQAGSVEAITRTGGAGKQIIAADQIADVFGIEMETATPAPAVEVAAPKAGKPKVAKAKRVSKKKPPQGEV